MSGPLDALLLGLSLGLGAGLAPGPLLALVLRSAVQDGLAAATRVAFSPLLTDVPIIVIALLAARTAPASVLAGLALAGGAFVAWLGVEALREKAPHGQAPGNAAIAADLDPATAPPSAAPTASPGTEISTTRATRRAIAWGAITNALSPHPWVFWLTVGSSVLARSTTAGSALFLAGFYLLLIGTKIAIAAAAVAGRDRLLHGRGYTTLLKATGLLMLAAGVLLIIDGVHGLAA